MAILQIPVRSDLEAYSFTITLDGSNYALAFRWNDRLSLWAMDISKTDQSPLLSGIPVQTGVDLVGRFSIVGLPKGSFLAFDTSGAGADAGRDNFGSDVLLLYKEAGT